jgi:plasmid stability protein
MMKDPMTLSVRIPTELHDGLRAIAAARETNVGIEHRRALRALIAAERRRLGLTN